ncbi:hypothetical protein JCM8547_002456 [Rhodosporidiobolus lusitaniae]
MYSTERGTTGTAMQASNGGDKHFLLRGVFIHPDHLAAGFFAEELASSPSPTSSETSSLVGYEDDEQKNEVELPTERLTGLALSCGLSSGAQDEMHDYFAPRAGSSNPSPFYSDNSLFSNPFSPFSDATSSSTATTPTCETAPHLSRRSSCMSTSSAMTSPSVTATFSFATFAPTFSPRAPSPSRAHPYSRSSHKGGVSMTRSVSTPVETQCQLDERHRAMSVAEGAVDQRFQMARSKSTASTPTLGSCPLTVNNGSGMSRAAGPSSGSLFSPLLQSFGEDWGSALPPRQVEQPAMHTFPYNVAGRPPVSPSRNARAYSYAGPENVSPSSNGGPPSPTLTRHNRRHSRVLAFTPIVPQTSELASASSCSVEVASPASPRSRLQRGMSF